MVTTTETQTEALVAQISKTVPRLTHRITDIGFGSGKMGLVLFYAYLARYTERLGYTDGELGTALLFLNQHSLLAFDDSRILAKPDELLLRFMHQKIDKGDLNVVSGALIAGHYFMHRLDTLPEAEQYLEDLIQGIKKNTQQDMQGRCSGFPEGLIGAGLVLMNQELSASSQWEKLMLLQ